MLELRNVTKRYHNGHFGVKGISLSQSSGVLALLGPNGAGKTTLIHLLSTLSKPTSGELFFAGIDLVKDPYRLRSRLGFMPQDFGVYDHLTALEFLTYVAALKGIHSRGKITEMLERVGLHTVMHRNAATFSGGMKQRLGIAQALINDPELLIVDEPTAGLDPEERIRFRNLLSTIGRGKLVIFSTHIVSDIESIATEIAVIASGQLAIHHTLETILSLARGKVWSYCLSSRDYESLKSRLTISSVTRKDDGLHLRVIAPDSPFYEAQPAPPTLEDAVLWVMSGLSQRRERTA